MLIALTARGDSAHPSTPHFTGALAHRATLAANSTHKIGVSAWVSEPTLISLGRWQLEVETGDEVDQSWSPRKKWSRIVEGGSVEVAHEGG